MKSKFFLPLGWEGIFISITGLIYRTNSYRVGWVESLGSTRGVMVGVLFSEVAKNTDSCITRARVLKFGE